jgi:hypothetical protein
MKIAEQHHRGMRKSKDLRDIGANSANALPNCLKQGVDMKVSELISALQKAQDKHGDIDVLDNDDYPISRVSKEESTARQAEEWDQPEGSAYLRLHSDK